MKKKNPWRNPCHAAQFYRCFDTLLENLVFSCTAVHGSTSWHSEVFDATLHTSIALHVALPTKTTLQIVNLSARKSLELMG